MRLHILQLDERPDLIEYPDSYTNNPIDYALPMRVSDIESELPNSFENLSYSNNSLESEICSLREAYEKRLFSFADDGGKWISVNEVQKQTAEEYWKELKQYPVLDMFQVITWRANELIDNLDDETLTGFFDIHTWQFVEWIAEIAEVGKKYHIIENLESHI